MEKLQNNLMVYVKKSFKGILIVYGALLLALFMAPIFKVMFDFVFDFLIKG